MKNLTSKTNSDTQNPSTENPVEVETFYTGQKPQFQQSANKPQKTLSDHPKHTELWE